MGKYFHLYENISKISPFEGPQYYLAPVWVFYLQAAFMGFVFFAGAPLNFVVLLATMKYKKLRVPLNFILVNISFCGFIFATFSVSQVFVSSMRGYYFLGHTLCALESAVGSAAGKPPDPSAGCVQVCADAMVCFSLLLSSGDRLVFGVAFL